MTHCQCQQPLMSCSMPLFQGLRTTPLLDIFPDSLTKLPTICLYGLGFFANIVLLYFLLKSFNLLNINNMHNFLYINLFINLIPPCKGQNENSKRDKRDETIVK